MARRPRLALLRPRAALGWLARRLGRWAESILREERKTPPPSGEPPVVPLRAGGPPPDWVERVRRAAPELLVPGSPQRLYPELLHPGPSSPRPSSPAPSPPPSPGEEGERPLIAPALFSHRLREVSPAQDPAGSPSPGSHRLRRLPPGAPGMPPYGLAVSRFSPSSPGEGGGEGAGEEGRGDEGPGRGELSGHVKSAPMGAGGGAPEGTRPNSAPAFQTPQAPSVPPRPREEPFPIPRPRESGPPAHWMERVRQGAPELLSPALVERPRPASPEPESAEPARSSAPELPGAAPEPGVPRSAIRPSLPEWPSQPGATAAPPVFPGMFAARIETVPAERSGRGRRERRWPSLPEPPREEPEEPAAERAAFQAWERRLRLDREQQGV